MTTRPDFDEINLEEVRALGRRMLERGGEDRDSALRMLEQADELERLRAIYRELCGDAPERSEPEASEDGDEARVLKFTRGSA